MNKQHDDKPHPVHKLPEVLEELRSDLEKVYRSFDTVTQLIYELKIRQESQQRTSAVRSKNVRHRT